MLMLSGWVKLRYPFFYILVVRKCYSLSLSLPCFCHLTHPLFVCHVCRKSDVDAEPEESPGSSSSSSSSSRSGAVDALSTGPAPPQASVGEPGQSGDSSCSDSDSPVDSSSCKEEEGEDEEDPTMFSSKFLSGANPLNAVSSAVNKFGLFGDDGEGDKKSPPQQGQKQSGEQKPTAGSGKDHQQQPHPHKPGQSPPMQKTQQPPKQGSPQLHGNGQTGPSNKPAGQQTTSKTGAQPEVQPKGEPPKNQPIQQSSPKPGAQQQTRMQQQNPTKTGAQGSTKVGSEVGKQQQASPKIGQQQHDSSKAGPEEKGIRATSQQQSSDKQGSKGPGPTGMTQAGSSSPGTAKARSGSTAVAKLCPVCKTTQLTKEPANHKTCTQCKMDVCSLCGFSPPDSNVSSGLI